MLVVNKNCHLLSSSEYNCLKMMQNFPTEFAQTAKDFLMLVTPNASRYVYNLVQYYLAKGQSSNLRPK